MHVLKPSRPAWLKTDPTLRFVGVVRGRAVYELSQPLVVCLAQSEAQLLQVTVPAGSRTNFASVPRIFWAIWPPAGCYSWAAVVHDYLYTQPGCSRFLADAFFGELMHLAGCPWWQRWPLYFAVRFFGWLGRRQESDTDPPATQ